jgi:hypothetical protein
MLGAEHVPAPRVAPEKLERSVEGRLTPLSETVFGFVKVIVRVVDWSCRIELAA